MNLLMNSDFILKITNLLDRGSVSRKELAESLNISVSSAGMIISKLISAEIIHEYASNNNSPGRNSKSAVFNHDPIFAVCQISDNHITASFFGYNMKILGTYSRMIDEPLFLDDSITAFIREICTSKYQLKSLCFVSDGYTSEDGFFGSTVPGLDAIPLVCMINEHMPDVKVYLENKNYWNLKDRNGINVIYDERNSNPKLTAIHDGVVLKGRSGLAGNIGKIRDLNGRTLFSKIKYSVDKNDYVFALAELFYTVILLYDPHNIYISTDRYTSIHEIIKYITEKLITEYNLNISDIPGIFGEGDNFDPSLSQLRRKMRDDSIFLSLRELQK
ncbi:MAG: hypothetical protein E7578_01090 [Ruminococcaceae bacterium]|nr:hypothetical protein [Oscillospiraceae bacterium]